MLLAGFLMWIPVWALLISADFSLSVLTGHLLKPEMWNWNLTTVYSWTYGIPVFAIGLLLVIAELVEPIFNKVTKSKTLL